MKIKKVITILSLITATIFTLGGCKRAEVIDYKKENIEFVNLAPGYYTMNQKTLPTYYIEDSDIKYVDVKSFFNTLNGFYMSSYFRFGSGLFSNNYSISVSVNTGSEVLSLSCDFNSTSDTITVSSPYFFNLVYQPSSTDYMAHIQERDGNYDNDNSVTFNLADYGFDILYSGGKCLVPLSIMNTIFCSHGYYNIYFDGDKYYGIFYDLTVLDSESLLELKTNSLNAATQTEELREETYNQFRFVMDYYYGLKEYKNISNFEEVFKDYKDDLLSTDPEKNRDAYYKIIVNYLDELHSRIGSYSFYNDPTLETGNWNLETTSDSRKKYKEINDKLLELSKDYYTSYDTYIHTYDDTAVIYLDSFITGSDEDISKENGYEYDSYEYMVWALNKIKDSGIKNVVLDLSLNGGGNAAALFRVLGFLSNDPVDYTEYDYLFKSKLTAYIDVDTDNDDDFDDDDAYTNYNWYVLSSYNTFSAANSATALAKSFNAKIIGQKSGGGMCSVMPVVLADSTTIEISSNLAQMAKINNEYVFIEGGIDVDIEIDYENFYNIEYIDSVLS